MLERDQIIPSNDCPTRPRAQAPPAGEAWRKSTGSARVLRYVSLLYTCFFFIEPYYRHSLTHWLWFAAFYVVFLGLYFGITESRGRTQQILFVLMFALGYAYFPFNQSASGAFVFPIVMLAFVLRSTRTYLYLLAATIMGIVLETWLFHLAWWACGTGVFFCIVVGLSNLSYSRQQQATYMLKQANEEIEHLAQVAERERIARDLHDLLGHTLTVIAIKSELANRLLEIDPQRAKQEMIDVEQTARKALAEVREAVVGYRSEGFPAEVMNARRTLQSAGVALSTDLEPADLTPPETNVLCLCLREAITNIVRHAHATTCHISLARNVQGLALTVHDNGVGSRALEGNGLRGMRERVEGLQGKMRMTPAVDGGNSLCVELPTAKPIEKIALSQQETHA
ncbi:sensor histidine kinase [Terriglobus roseus]|uniref:Two-component system, NarL family, sensor histidine kinase DesK n=1 Tax=Terriglobus roseus TaxID=392734 RepID=A0A1H4TV23_9BACT|nr:sensor histidine kinase [Terriglobus roseus]SEC60322.1 two-component system, NarL family, sensor histidine kinase DesK [Terriglobus roseus]